MMRSIAGVFQTTRVFRFDGGQSRAMVGFVIHCSAFCRAGGEANS